ncbi:hypothetical protein RHMOL_Rhmol09G0167300 [Rhododendron molle]|uniref:Uncharacterized protein n=2 Tax=Rhododendron molle TaxID=49168 RepID=A0ACC0MEI3_RHOML|nr:hypothetical protein RHMOL_Rhmol09G0167300 [Rhododendron molle]KAI8539250.1 hypothetical protein RHMOL_Rhmol09G0167300 [Rhododendron molle]
MAATPSLTLPAVHCLSSFTTTNTLRAYGPTCPFQRSNFFKFNSLHYSTLKPSRLSVSHKIGIVPTHVSRVPILCCLADNSVESVPSESAPTSATEDLKEATIDLKLPRRSLLLHFTCNACGERSKKLINRVAYERGTVFVQCAGCQQHHKLIDNLGLVVEYDFREESGMDSNADQV